MTDIINRVTESGLISLDLADYKPKIDIEGIDISHQLWQGLVLKEKDFRQWIKENNWEQFKDKAVFIHCSTDAIIPTWAFMLIASKLENNASIFLVGSKEDLQKQIILQNIKNEDLKKFIDGRVIVKGCSDIPCPDFAMVELLKHLQPVVKSLMYGEPCSTVPIFKRK
jgi:hypothetical protein